MKLKEFHCGKCSKLLCKGILKDKDNFLEVKCKSCGNVQLFRGPDARIIKKRSELICHGLIPDPEKDS